MVKHSDLGPTLHLGMLNPRSSLGMPPQSPYLFLEELRPRGIPFGVFLVLLLPALVQPAVSAGVWVFPV